MTNPSERYVRVVITTDVRVTDPTWDDQTLRENLVHYVEIAIERAEERSRNYYALGNDDEGNDRAAYELLSDDVTVFIADDFVLDLADIAALPDEERAAMSTIANLPPIERRTFWYSDYTPGVPA
jgi:hypothetical protein